MRDGGSETEVCAGSRTHTQLGEVSLTPGQLLSQLRSPNLALGKPPQLSPPGAPAGTCRPPAGGAPTQGLCRVTGSWLPFRKRHEMSLWGRERGTPEVGDKSVCPLSPVAV